MGPTTATRQERRPPPRAGGDIPMASQARRANFSIANKSSHRQVWR